MRPQAHTTNAIWNLLGGASMSVLVLLVPFWLNQSLGAKQYALWALAYQVIVYIPLLGFGLNQILIREVAGTLRSSDTRAFHTILSNGFWMLIVLMAASFLLVGITGFWMDQLLPISPDARLQFQWMWWVLGGTGSLGLLSLYFFGVFGGHQQYLWENTYKTMVVLSFVLGLWILSVTKQFNVLSLAWVYAFAVGIALLSLGLVYYLEGFPKPQRSQVDRATTAALVRSMYGLGVWQFSMVLVSGLDLWIVARLDFDAVAGYALALSCMTFLMGVGSALFSPSLPVFAKALTDQDRSQFVALFRQHQRWLIATALAIAVGIMVLPNTLWLALFKDSSAAFIAVMPILLLATVLRLLTLLYAYALVGANRQHQIIASPLLEGVLNVGLSIVLGICLGPVGVALGTLAGAVLCLAMHTLYNMPRQRHWVPVHASDLLFPWTKG